MPENVRQHAESGFGSGHRGCAWSPRTVGAGPQRAGMYHSDESPPPRFLRAQGSLPSQCSESLHGRARGLPHIPSRLLESSVTGACLIALRGDLLRTCASLPAIAFQRKDELCWFFLQDRVEFFLEGLSRKGFDDKVIDPCFHGLQHVFLPTFGGDHHHRSIP